MSAIPGRSLHLSDGFVISCGTVSFDLAREKILLVQWSKTGEIFLPKGRKNVGETLQEAALRETYEETGYRATILPLKIPTLATPRTDHEQMEVTEPIAVSQRTTQDKLKIIFWFASSADSEGLRDPGTQQEGEDFQPIWKGLNDALSVLSFRDDIKVASVAINAAFGKKAVSTLPVREIQ